jgi:hypothetical protein
LAELEAIAGAIEALDHAVAMLHQPAIVALADQDIIVIGLRGLVARLAALAPEVRRAKDHIRPEPSSRGRPRNQRALITAAVVIDAYRRIFGGRAELPAGQGGMPGLLRLTTDVFGIVGIKAQPAAALAAAIANPQTVKPRPDDPWRWDERRSLEYVEAVNLERERRKIVALLRKFPGGENKKHVPKAVR